MYRAELNSNSNGLLLSIYPFLPTMVISAIAFAIIFSTTHGVGIFGVVSASISGGIFIGATLSLSTLFVTNCIRGCVNEKARGDFMPASPTNRLVRTERRPLFSQDPLSPGEKLFTPLSFGPSPKKRI